ncbi:MAG: hypothetical protein ACI4S2_18580, partial [Lachnospiraceae bacterium]
IIDEECSSMGVVAYIDDCIGYDEKNKKIYVVHNDSSSKENTYEWGSFSYVSLEDLIQQGQELIH